MKQSQTKIAPLAFNPLFDGKDNLAKFIESGHKDFDDNGKKDEKKHKIEEKKEEIEDIYARKKRLLLQRDLLLKKKQKEREKFMKNYQKVKNLNAF